MSYSHRPGQFKSHLTGKTYAYETTGKRQRESKAAALASLQADEKVMTDASTLRHGRELSLREQLRGGPMPIDNRTIRERVAEEVQHAKRPDEPANPYSTRISELEARLRHAERPKDRASIIRKLSALKEASDKYDEKAATQKAFDEMMASAEVQKHVKHAETCLERLLLDPASPEMAIIAARNRLAKIKATGDVDTYRNEWKAAEAMTKEALQARQGELEAALDDVRREFGVETGLGDATSNLAEAEMLDASGHPQ